MSTNPQKIPYHMKRPSLADAQGVLEQIYGATAGDRWNRLLGQAGLTGHETDPAAVRRLAEAMMASDEVMALSGRSLMIQVNTYEYLLTASEIIAGAG